MAAGTTSEIAGPAASPPAGRLAGKKRRWWTRSRRIWALSALMGLFAALGAMALDFADRFVGRDWAELASLNAYDLGLTSRGSDTRAMVKDPRVVIVQIDEGSLKDLGAASPGAIPRAIYGQLVDRLRELGVRAIAFDIVFTPEKPDDAQFAKALERMGGRVVVGAEYRKQMRGGSSETAADVLSTPTHSAPDIRYAAGHWGWVNIPQDADNTIRRFQWYEPGLNDDAEERKMPMLAVAAAALYLKQQPEQAVAEVDRGVFCGRRVTAEQAAGMLHDRPTSLIDYYLQSPTAGFRTFTFKDILDAPAHLAEGRRDYEHLRDAVVVVGETAGVSQDVHKVPGLGNYGTTTGGQEQRGAKWPGVDIQASTVHTILSGRYTRRASPGAELALLFAVSIGTALLTRRLRPGPAFGAGVGIVTLLWVGSVYMILAWYYWLDPVRATVGAVLAFMLEMALLQVTERRQQQEVRHVFGRLVGRAVMDDLLREDDPPELGGEPRQITLLFSDLQGFTTISETLPAPQLVRLLNEYFEVMLEIIEEKYGGTLDKLMGDGIMAYFGAPAPQPDHARIAVECALEMQAALAEFRARPQYRDLPPFYMRIGLHTGEAVVGLIGKRGRENYSVIGDVANVASRLEGLNKEFGTTIMLSEETLRATRIALVAEPHGEVAVKGRTKPVPVYSIGPKADD